MANWEKFGNYPESMYAVDFRQQNPELAKALSNAQGFYEVGKVCHADGYTYKVIELVAKKTGSKFLKIQREKMTTTESTPGVDNRQAAITQAHIENLTEYKQTNFQLNIISNHLVNINDTMVRILKEFEILNSLLLRIAVNGEAKNDE